MIVPIFSTLFVLRLAATQCSSNIGVFLLYQQRHNLSKKRIFPFGLTAGLKTDAVLRLKSGRRRVPCVCVWGGMYHEGLSLRSVFKYVNINVVDTPRRCERYKRVEKQEKAKQKYTILTGSQRYSFAGARFLSLNQREGLPHDQDWLPASERGGATPFVSNGFFFCIVFY